MLSVSHGLPATAFLTDELVVMNAGTVMETGPTRALLADPQNAYTRMLVGAYRDIESLAP